MLPRASGIYIHIPFCKRKCSYCDFVSFTGELALINKYCDFLLSEIRMLSEKNKNNEFQTVFIGGGTPSILDCSNISEIIKALFDNFSIAKNAEISIECNPGTVTEEKLESYLQAGINRISLGLQSADDSLLSLIGRIHKNSDFLCSIEYAKRVGFKNINADIMYGLPCQSTEQFKTTLNEVIDLRLPHISAYSLILEDDTPLKRAVESGKLSLPNEDIEYEMQSICNTMLSASGYKRYEISNYALSGFECLHNKNYWDCGSYIGIGLNSHSAIKKSDKWIRYRNYSDLESYFTAIEEKRLPIEGTEDIDLQQQMFEYIMLGLRKTEGFSAADFFKRFNKSFFSVYSKAIESARKEGFMTLEPERVYLTNKGLDLQNRALLLFMEE